MKDLRWLKEALIAHRGLHTRDLEVPENTLIAFKKALDLGYGIECDVNISKDGHPVVFHDIDLKRLCDKDVRVDMLSLDELKTFRIGISQEGIPTLSELLQLVDGKVPLLIELKPKGNVINLCEAVYRELINYHGTYAIFSFHPKVVYWFKKHAPHVIRGQISESFKSEKNLSFISRFMMRYMVFNALTKPDFISYGIKDMPFKPLDRLKKKGLTIISFSARSQTDFDFVKKYYDNVVFEYFIPKK